jgi:hypothetical protein
MAKLKLTYLDGTTKEVSPNAYAQIAAKRHCGLDAIKAEDPEAGFYAAFVQDVGAVEAAKPGSFDAWLETIVDMERIREPGDEVDPSDPPTATGIPPGPSPELP